MGENTGYNSFPDGTPTGEAAACEIAVWITLQMSRALGASLLISVINDLVQNQGQFPGN